MTKTWLLGKRLNHLVSVTSISMGVWLLLSNEGHSKPFQIQVLDEATSRGIPMVILETSLATRHVTDSNGVVAFDEPLAMDHQIFFKPVSDGYSYQAPPLAMDGAVLKPAADSSATLVMRRDMIAERLYRITGAGIYQDTLALGGRSPIAEPLLNAGVIGQDSTLCAVFGGKAFWIWGDTSRMGHPLSANFRATGATSDLPTSGGLSADLGVNLDYFEKADFVKPMMPMLPGDRSGVFWFTCLMSVTDAKEAEHLLSWYNQITMPGMKTVKRGIVEFDPDAKEFRPIVDYPTTAPLQPAGHAVHVSTTQGDYIYITTSAGQFRVRDSYEEASDPTKYEALTCIKDVGRFTTATAVIDRDVQGRVVYSWRVGAEPTGGERQRQLMEAGKLETNECIFRPVDALTGKPFLSHGCSIAWNDHRQRWIMISSELMGTSMLGELWYLEAESPEGPWLNAVKILTHDKYSFYNPLLHPELAAADDRYVYFEGTYTKTFSGVEVATPFYDYNQIMYRVDLNDERLRMPPPPQENVRFIIDQETKM